MYHGIPLPASTRIYDTGCIMTVPSPTSKAELEAALDELVLSAHRNGVHVGNGGYELLHDDNTLPDWDLTIVRMG